MAKRDSKNLASLKSQPVANEVPVFVLLGAMTMKPGYLLSGATIQFGDVYLTPDRLCFVAYTTAAERVDLLHGALGALMAANEYADDVAQARRECDRERALAWGEPLDERMKKYPGSFCLERSKLELVEEKLRAVVLTHGEDRYHFAEVGSEEIKEYVSGACLHQCDFTGAFLDVASPGTLVQMLVRAEPTAADIRISHQWYRSWYLAAVWQRFVGLTPNDRRSAARHLELADPCIQAHLRNAVLDTITSMPAARSHLALLACVVGAIAVISSCVLIAASAIESFSPEPDRIALPRKIRPDEPIGISAYRMSPALYGVLHGCHDLANQSPLLFWMFVALGAAGIGGIAVYVFQGHTVDNRREYVAIREIIHSLGMVGTETPGVESRPA